MPALAAGLSPRLGHFTLPDGGNTTGGVAADNMPALPREDLGTDPFYAQRVQTPNHKQILPANCRPPHHTCCSVSSSSYSNPKPQIPKAPCPSKTLAAQPSSFTPHGCCCTRQPRLHSIPQPALWITHSGPHYATVSSGQSPAGFPERPHPHPGPTPPAKHKTAFLSFARKRRSPLGVS